jgi:CheY-like chemotaxis protein
VSAPSLTGRVVLVVEDHDDTRAALVRLLAALGAQVHEATDGLAGLTELARWRPDVVFCDLAMPIMDGLEFAQLMRQNPRYHHVLLIAVTGKDSPSTVRETWQAGFDAHLVKPVTGEALASIARRLAGGSDLLSTA